MRHTELALRRPVTPVVVFVAMFAVVPVLGWSILLAKRGNYALHKRVQLALAVILLVAIIAAVALTLRQRTGARRQNPSLQVRVQREASE